MPCQFEQVLPNLSSFDQSTVSSSLRNLVKLKKSEKHHKILFESVFPNLVEFLVVFFAQVKINGIYIHIDVIYPDTFHWEIHPVSSHTVAYDYSCADWDGLCDHLRDDPLEDIFTLGASPAASEFCKRVQVGVDVYIPHRKHQVKLHLSPWFSAACAAAIAHRNHFFRLYQQNKSSESKVKFRKASKETS